MCVGNLFQPKAPKPPPRMDPSPPLKPSAPPPDMPTPEVINKDGEKEKLKIKKQKEDDARKFKDPGKDFDAFDPSQDPGGPPGGVAPPV